MFGGFEVGATYIRRRDIHAEYGGQQQGGISTPISCPAIFAFTGSTGTQHGYADGWTEAGTFRYFGEGRRGDMQWRAGNVAIRDHVSNGKDLLLFETLGRGRVRFMGQFINAGHSLVQAPDGNGTLRRSIVFNLVPLESYDRSSLSETAPEGSTPPHGDLLLLRKRANEAAASPAATSSAAQAKRNYYARSEAVKAYVLARSNGVCECCGKDAPFVTKAGTPYLEPHHIRRLSDGGPDHPAHVGAVCPNCHCEIHYGAAGRALNATLAKTVHETEARLDAEKKAVPIEAFSS